MREKNNFIDSTPVLVYNLIMKRNKSLEDYLESILLLSRENEFVHRVDVARSVGVSQPAVQKAVKILQNRGFVECDGLHIYLTSTGENYACKNLLTALHFKKFFAVSRRERRRCGA